MYSLGALQHPSRTGIRRFGSSTSSSAAAAPCLKPAQKHRVLTCTRALPNETNESSSRLEVAVPKDQRPVNELANLKQAWLYSWGTLDTPQYVTRLGLIFGFFFAVIAGPIAYQTFDPFEQPLEWLLSATTGSLLVVAVVVLRIYLGWTYVGDRLMSAAVEYEETGWYDGQVFVKPPEVLTRDRLLGMYEVKPVLQKLKGTMLGSGGALLTTALALLLVIQNTADADGMYGRGAAKQRKQMVSDGLQYSMYIRNGPPSLYRQDVYRQENADEEMAFLGQEDGEADATDEVEKGLALMVGMPGCDPTTAGSAAAAGGRGGLLEAPGILV